MRIALLIFSFVCIIACSKNNCDQNCNNCVVYNTPFKIEAGNTYCFDDHTSMSIIAINNEFCPCTVTCVWEGQMTVDLQWIFSDGSELVYQYKSSDTEVNEPIPNNLIINSLEEDIVYEGTCPDIEKPKILSTLITVESR